QVDSFIDNLAQQTCDWEFRCCTDPEIAMKDGHRYTTMEDCVPYQALALENELFLSRLAVKEGRLRVDHERAAACLEQMTNQACNPTPGTPAPPMDPMAMDACADVFVGTTPVGKECVYSNECVSGAHCVADQDAVGRGVCVPFQEDGDICNSDADCDPKVKQLYCGKGDFHCHLRAKLGEACAYTTDANGQNPTLPLLVECDNQLGNVYCDPSSNTCAQLPAAGEPCLSPPPPGVGSSCDPDPTLGLVCDTSGGGTSGVCRAPGSLGDSCTNYPCGANLYCDTTQYTCRALPDFGQSCASSNGQCKKPYFCNFNRSETCDQPASVGESCQVTPCDTGLYCDSSSEICRSLLPDHSPCTSSSQCASLDCSYGAGASTLTCQPRATTSVECVGR
ncbi:MAG TPA: hypothetical protein VII38_16580, partial [Polyangia bacterium]